MFNFQTLKTKWLGFFYLYCENTNAYNLGGSARFKNCYQPGRETVDGVSRSGNPGDDGDKGLGGAWEKR